MKSPEQDVNQGAQKHRTRQTVVAVLASLLSASVAGCMLPAYKAPGGYSGTYRRHLQQPVPVVLGDHEPRTRLHQSVGNDRVFFPSTTRRSTTGGDDRTLAPTPLNDVAGTGDGQLPQSVESVIGNPAQL